MGFLRTFLFEYPRILGFPRTIAEETSTIIVSEIPARNFEEILIQISEEILERHHKKFLKQSLKDSMGGFV